MRSGGERRARFEMLVRRAVVTARQRRPLTRLALPRRRMAPGDPAIEQTGLDLLLDERRRRADALLHRQIALDSNAANR